MESHIIMKKIIIGAALIFTLVMSASTVSALDYYPGFLIRYKSQGEHVKTIQMCLSEMGYTNSGTFDGKYGPKTLAQIKSYQASKGLKQDGIVGPLTWAALNCKTQLKEKSTDNLSNTEKKTQNEQSVKLNYALPMYIGGQAGWPPQAELSNKPFSCTPGINSTEAEETTTVRKDINGTTYCITTIGDVEMGGVYNTYRYTRAEGSGTWSTSFILKFSSCQNYDEVAACTEIQNDFVNSLDELIANL